MDVRKHKQSLQAQAKTNQSQEVTRLRRNKEAVGGVSFCVVQRRIGVFCKRDNMWEQGLVEQGE